MVLGVSPVYICSAALNKLGAESIISLADDSRRARMCNRLWPIVRDAVLTAKNWGVSFARVILTKDNDAPTFDYAARYRLPEDFFFLLETDLPQDERYRIEGDFLLCDYDTLSIVYIKKTEDSTTFGPLLIDALISAVKAEIAYTITGSKSIQDDAIAERDAKLATAATRESQQRSITALTNNILIRVRR